MTNDNAEEMVTTSTPRNTNKQTPAPTPPQPKQTPQHQDLKKKRKKEYNSKLTRAGASAGHTEGTRRVRVVVVRRRVGRRAGRVVGGRVVEVAQRRQVLLGGGRPHALFHHAGVQARVTAAAHQ